MLDIKQLNNKSLVDLKIKLNDLKQKTSTKEKLVNEEIKTRFKASNIIRGTIFNIAKTQITKMVFNSRAFKKDHEELYNNYKEKKIEDRINIVRK